MGKINCIKKCENKGRKGNKLIQESFRIYLKIFIKPKTFKNKIFIYLFKKLITGICLLWNKGSKISVFFVFSTLFGVQTLPIVNNPKHTNTPLFKCIIYAWPLLN